MEAPQEVGYITPQQLLDALPLDGDGVSLPQATNAVESAKEDVIGRTGDREGKSAMLRTAVAHMAQADLEDFLYGEDAKDRGGTHLLRKNAERLVENFLNIRALKQQGGGDADGIADATGYIREVELF